MEQVVKVNTGRGSRTGCGVGWASAGVLFRSFGGRVVGSGGTGALEGMEIRAVTGDQRTTRRCKQKPHRGEKRAQASGEGRVAKGQEGRRKERGEKREAEKQCGQRQAGWMASDKWVAPGGGRRRCAHSGGGPLDDPARPSYCRGCKLKPRRQAASARAEMRAGG